MVILLEVNFQCLKVGIFQITYFVKIIYSDTCRGTLASFARRDDFNGEGRKAVPGRMVGKLAFIVGIR
jgi:hypothetical protein